MSLKRFAMLAAISYNNQQNYNNNNNSNTNYNNNNNKVNNNKTQTTFGTTATPESTTKIINSNKSTLIQLKQQQQQQSQQIFAPTSLSSTATTILSATSNSSLSPTNTLTKTDHQQHNGIIESVDSSSDVVEDDSSSYSSESSESLDLDQHPVPERQPSNTYTSTTYYGSGFGVFHQQNIRSNGGGIALITGSSASNGLGGGSYSNGINNNVNLLLGGAMLTLITTILCVVCYCCHRNIKKRTEAAYRQQRQWLENDPNMEIYSVEQCYETSGLFVGDSMDGLATIPALHHEPPPSYDAVVAMQEQQQLLIQQHQQQLMMQQQLLQQQLPTNNSPPPGYRSSLDVSAIMQGRGNALGGVLGMAGGSIISGMEINSLASSDANIRAANSHSPIDPLLNYNDVNGNVAAALTVATTTPTSNRATVSYLRNKQQQQQQRNVAPNQLSQLNMKKVLQAQSCCSLQRAEVENMWNAAAAALAARSAHLPSDSRASTTASSSSPTLAINTRKLSQGYNTSKTNTPETFGSRYLKQNYYRRGCPLCGKFRYDNDSTLSISMESNLDTLAAALAEEQPSNGEERDQEATQNNLNNNNNIASTLDDRHHNENNEYDEAENNEEQEEEDGDDEVDDNDNDVEQQCSCLNSKRKSEIRFKQQNRYQKVTTQADNTETQEHQHVESNIIKQAAAIPTPTTTDANDNCAIATERQSAASNNNNNNHNDNTTMDDSLNMPSTSAAASTTTQRTLDPPTTTSSAASTPSVTINLDCINENGIISLDMSKIIDKTGLPTYDAALKLESSGYV
ncbi:1-phosphatidylinositol 3-phosphate 5-kinase [Calliphora vicina]|uniref:1-phosphatidylinositol 3-phosphate 5-kinase n=1 Tax=Calliphora vicina TaxID=7373 RepID=UPI00325BA42F